MVNSSLGLELGLRRLGLGLGLSSSSSTGPYLLLSRHILLVGRSIVCGDRATYVRGWKGSYATLLA